MVNVTSRKPRSLLFRRAVRYAWLVIASLNCIWVMYLNSYARVMRTLLEYFADQRDVIVSGFSAEAVTRYREPTFPMWGCSLFTMFSTEQLVLVPIQLVFALLVSGATAGMNSLISPHM